MQAHVNTDTQSQPHFLVYSRHYTQHTHTLVHHASTQNYHVQFISSQKTTWAILYAMSMEEGSIQLSTFGEVTALVVRRTPSGTTWHTSDAPDPNTTIGKWCHTPQWWHTAATRLDRPLTSDASAFTVSGVLPVMLPSCSIHGAFWYSLDKLRSVPAGKGSTQFHNIMYNAKC